MQFIPHMYSQFYINLKSFSFTFNRNEIEDIDAELDVKMILV